MATHEGIRLAISACRSHFVAAAVFSFGANLLYLALPLYMLQVSDRVLRGGSVPTLIMLTFAAMLALGTLASLDILRTRVLVRAGLRLDKLLIDNIFRIMLERTHAANGAARGQLLRDFDGFRHTITGAGIHALFDTPWVPIYILAIFFIHPVLGAASIAFALILLALTFANEFLTRKSIAAGSEATARNYSSIESGLRNAEVIQAMGMLNTFTRRWKHVRSSALGFQAIASDRNAWVSGTIKFCRLFMQVLILALGAWFVIEHSITAGGMFAAVIILGRALQPLEQLVGAWRQIIGAWHSFGRIATALSDSPSPQSRVSLPRPAGRVLFDGVMLFMPGMKRPVLSGVSFALEPGETLGVIGPTAAGKSTLARIIVGVRRSSAGAVRLDGADVLAWNRDEFGQYVGYLPQDIELFPGTVAENISRFATQTSENIVHAATLAGAHDMILALPQGYETEVGESGAHLSGGQRQRIALARAVYGNPALVVLDEPNSSLDADGEIALKACLLELRHGGTTVIIITHRIALLNEADKILFLRDGKVEAIGPRKDIVGKLKDISSLPVNHRTEKS